MAYSGKGGSGAWASRGSSRVPPGSEHVLVIDCGSSGTRLNIVRRPAPGDADGRWASVPWQDMGVPYEGGAAVRKVGYNRLETTPGIHHAADRGVRGARDALAPLLDWARRALPAEVHAHTPILLFATAGVRKLEMKPQVALMSNLKHVLSISGFRFAPEWAKIITGEDEGIFSWASVNYKEGHFAGSGPSSHAPVAEWGGSASVAPGAEAANVVDLGGSSLQVSCVVASAEASDEVRTSQSASILLPARIMNVTYDLRAASFNHFGMNDLFASVMKEWKGEGGASPAAQAPPGEGGDENGNGKGKGGSYHPCLQRGFVYRGKDGKGPEEIAGRFDWDACRALVARAAHSFDRIAAFGRECESAPIAPRLHASHAHRAKEGARQQQKVSTPNQERNFLALSGFYLVYNFFGIDLASGLGMRDATVREACAQPFASLSTEQASHPDAGAFCFRAVYTSAILTQGLGLAESRVKVAQSSEWALGAALLLDSELKTGGVAVAGGVGKGGTGGTGGTGGKGKVWVWVRLKGGLAAIVLAAAAWALWRATMGGGRGGGMASRHRRVRSRGMGGMGSMGGMERAQSCGARLSEMRV